MLAARRSRSRPVSLRGCHFVCRHWCWRSGVLCSGNGCSACAVPELAVSRVPSLVVGRLEVRRNFGEQAALPETDRNGRNEAVSQRADRQAGGHWFEPSTAHTLLLF